MKTVSTVLLMLVATTAAANPHLNLDFEAGLPGESPTTWFAGGEGYVGEISTDDPHGGEQCLDLARQEPASEGFGVATNSFPITAAAGKKIRYTGWIRTAGITERFAGLWWRADGPEGVLAFDNMMTRGVKGDTEWTAYTIELEIPAEVTNINFGCILPGNGEAWFDDLQVEIDGKVYGQVAPEPVVITEQQVNWVAETAHAFATDDPDHGQEDLAFLKDLVGDARIVALGEGTHGTAEFFRMKHRITRYLVEEMGFTIFGIEATMPESEFINRYVQTGEGDPAALVAGMFFWTWRTREVQDLVEWMWEHNRQGGRVEFHGFDMQFPALAMKKALDAIGLVDADLKLRAAVVYAELRGMLMAARQTSQERALVPGRLRDESAAIREALAARREDLLEHMPPAEADWAIQHARLVEQYCLMASGAAGYRDLAMADNADWLLAQAGPEAKIVLWAHNGHVSRVGYSQQDAMGSHLHARHGADMIVLGFHFHWGTYTAVKRNEGIGSWGTSPSRPGTVEWAFQQTGQPRLVLDLRLADPESANSGWLHRPVEFRSIGSMAMDDAFSSGVMADRYDALVYFETSTPTVLLDVVAPSPWAAWEE